MVYLETQACGLPVVALDSPGVSQVVIGGQTGLLVAEDAGEAMAGLAWEVLHPRLVAVRLTGKLSGWTSPEDVITYLCGLLTVKGWTNKIIEYFGPGTEALSCTAKATITNMGAELGATTSVFPFDKRMADYLRATGRAEIARMAEDARAQLSADHEVLNDPAKYYDEVVEIDLSSLEPQVVGPHTPDLTRAVSRLAADVKDKGYPPKLSAALIGSCTKSSYEDIGRAAHIARWQGDSASHTGEYVNSKHIHWTHIKGMPAMSRGLDDLPALTLPKEVRMVRVQTQQDQTDWLNVLMEGFEEPESSRSDFEQFLARSLAEPTPVFEHFIARWRGEPCAISSLLYAEQGAGIYHVTTLSHYRGRRLGKALTLAAMQAARQAGYQQSILFATPSGFPIYKQLGFETVTTADGFVWSPNE